MRNDVIIHVTLPSNCMRTGVKSAVVDCLDGRKTDRPTLDTL